MIETTPGVHISVYDYPGLITKQMVGTASQEIWTIVNNANIQHWICSNTMYLLHRTFILDKVWNTIKNHKHNWEKKAAEMDQNLFVTYATLQKERRVRYSTSSEK